MRRISAVVVLVACGCVGETPAPGDRPDSDLLARGTYLMESIVACGNCHTPKTPDGNPIEDMQLAGGFVIEEPGFTAYAPNITMDPETGIGDWSDADIIRAIRDGVRPDGTLIGPPMPIPWYRGISDLDVEAIVTYLRSVRPVTNTVPKSDYHIPLPPNWGPPVASVPEVSRDDRLAYGKYLAVSLGHCTECHTPMVDGQYDFERTGLGGRVFGNIFGLGYTVISPNITPHPTAGIGAWNDEEIKRAITTGISRDGRKLLPSMAFSYYANISDEDLDALITYLRSLPPQPTD